MSDIRATCDDCGDIKIEDESIDVRLCIDTHQASVAFQCPCCQMRNARYVDEFKMHQLIAAGVPFTRWRLPHEMYEPRGEGWPPITDDTSIDFHIYLDSHPDTLVGDRAFQDALDEYHKQRLDYRKQLDTPEEWGDMRNI